MILVTGATGFIGSYVVRTLLQRGVDVVAASRYPWRAESRFIIGDELPELVRPDLCKASDVVDVLDHYRPEGVVHLEALVDPVALRDQPTRALEFNARPNFNLLEAGKKLGVGKYVLASSIAVLPRIEREPISVDHPLVTRSGGPAGGFYGTAKAVSELIALGYRDATEMDVRIVRPSAVYGYGMQWPIGLKPVIEGLSRGLPVTMPRHAPPRDYTPVEDVAAVLCATLECGPGDDVVFNAGTGEPLTTSDRLLAAVRSVFPGGDITVTDDDLDPTGVESAYRGILDMAPVRDQLGVQPAYASLRDGLSIYADRYRRSLSES